MTDISFTGIDIGGTFTDAVMYKDGKFYIHKTLTTKQNPALGVIEALKNLPEGGFTLTHGSTLATNAVLERKGSKTALIATSGVQDILFTARQDRPALYEPEPRKKSPLVERQFCYGAPERTDSKGAILKPPDMEKVREYILEASKNGITSLAVCLLFSFKNDETEKKIKESASKLLDFVTISSEVLPEYREYERTSTTVLNAYISPILKTYITYLEQVIKEMGGVSFRIMESGGGIIPAAEAGRLGVRTILSGPAGGVAGAFHIAKQAGIDKIITLDMGGTSTDVSLCDGFIAETREGEIDGFPIRVPMVDIVTIGAGGGSIAFADEAGSLKTGPRSAGSDPGPAAFGKGTEPTVTDALVALGYLTPEDFQEKNVMVDKQRTEESLETVAVKLGLTKEQTADGIIKIALSHMEKALRVVSLERGYDPSSFTLIPFGGAGPIHSPSLAEALGINRILIPQYPGVLSALGMLLCDFRMDFTRTILLPVDKIDENKYREEFQSLYERVFEFLHRNKFANARLEFSFDARYRGQSFELNIPFGSAYCVPVEDGFRLPPLPEPDFTKVTSIFHNLHQIRYNFHRESETVEIVNFRLNLITGSTKPVVCEAEPVESTAEPETEREIIRVCDDDIVKVLIPVFSRENLKPGMKIPSPAIIRQYDTIIHIPENWNAVTDKWLNLIIEKKQ
ncbi:MAG: hydantoinase/oxoprolinase family protein [Firmicutes bacterium]|nr:hydantoinase/oxoprolinase family protein [Bacillota bacterium]